MKNFIVGCVVATFVWLGVLYAQSTGAISVFSPSSVDENPAVPDPSLEITDETSKERSNRRSRRGKRRRGRRLPGKPTYDTRSGVSGDSLGKTGPRELSMGQRGGEQQLSGVEVDRGIDGVFRGIERCLILVPSAAPATGKVIVGMHIASSGKVTKANLKGPNVIIQGESGACIRKTVKSITYPSFDGPDMVVNYPMIFD